LRPKLESRRPDVAAVVHAHPPIPVATSAAGPRIAADSVSPKTSAPSRMASTGVRKENAATVDEG